MKLPDTSRRPWPLRPMALAHGIALPDIPPLLHFAQRIDVAVWPLQRM